MCGIFGMIGDGAQGNTLQALKLLEYRGYDSAGIAVKRQDGIHIYKSEGRIQNLEKLLPQDVHCKVAIGHTRWATHGAVSTENAHPFYSPDKRFAVVHNGIIENYQALKKQFTLRGAVFTSQTDSETVAHLLQNNYSGNVLGAVLATANNLVGSFAIAITTAYDDNLYAIKNKSPLVIGMSDSGVYLCSDIRCVSHWADRVAVAPDKTVVVATAHGVYFYDFDGNPIKVHYFTPEKAEKEQPVDGDFMLKEIHEIPSKIRLAKSEYFNCGGLKLEAERVKRFTRIYLIGCGTAYNSGLQIAAVARKLLDVDIVPIIASEFIYDSYPVDDNTLTLLISQSGETADTLAAAKLAKDQGAYLAAITNVAYSSLTRLADCVLETRAGAEIAVAATKSFNAQLAVLFMLANLRAGVKENFSELSHLAKDTLSVSENVRSWTPYFLSAKSVYFIGRGIDYCVALEGSLKLKEISYLPSEGYAAGELKHGTLALVDEKTPVVAILTQRTLAEKTMNAVHETRSRGARVFLITTLPEVIQNCEATASILIPACTELFSPVLSVIPLQALAYYTALARGNDPDKPRHLAKSVTVE